MSTKFNNAVVSVLLPAWLLLCSALVSQAAMVLDDPLQGATLGTRLGGALVAVNMVYIMTEATISRTGQGKRTRIFS